MPYFSLSHFSKFYVTFVNTVRVEVFDGSLLRVGKSVGYSVISSYEFWTK